MKTYKTQRTKSFLWSKMCHDLKTNTRKIKSNIDKYIGDNKSNIYYQQNYALCLISNRRYIMSLFS